MKSSKTLGLFSQSWVIFFWFIALSFCFISKKCQMSRNHFPGLWRYFTILQNSFFTRSGKGLLKITLPKTLQLLRFNTILFERDWISFVWCKLSDSQQQWLATIFFNFSLKWKKEIKSTFHKLTFSLQGNEMKKKYSLYIC